MDDEVKGEGNSYDFGARLLDPRVGRWWSLDEKKKAEHSMYAFAMNSPIMFVDPDGKDDYYFDLEHKAVYIIKNGKPNRYFINTAIIPNEETSQNLTVGQYVPIQYSVNSKEVETIFSDNAWLYRKALEITPTDSPDYAKPYEAYNSVDERVAAAPVLVAAAIVGGLVAAPYAISEAGLLAESGPYWKAALTGGSGTSLFTLNSFGTGMANATITAGSQYIGNGFDFSAIDPYQTAVSGLFGGPGSLFMQSSFTMSSENGYNIKQTSLGDFALNVAAGLTGSKIDSKVSSIGLSSFSPSVGGYMEGNINLGAQSAIESINNLVKEELDYKQKDEE